MQNICRIYVETYNKEDKENLNCQYLNIEYIICEKKLFATFANTSKTRKARKGTKQIGTSGTKLITHHRVHINNIP